MLPVVILAGGVATRLRPLTETIPKAMVDVNGEPFIAHQLRLLRANGIERVIICAGYLGEVVQAYVGDGARFGLQAAFSFDGSRLLGTGGAVKKALPLLGDAFFVLYGDSYLPCDYRAVQTAFTSSGRLSLMTVFRNDGHWDTSNVEFVNGRVVAYNKQHRTPGMHYIDYGLGIFTHSAFEIVPDGRSYDLAALYQDLLTKGELAAYEVGQRFYEIGSLEGLEETRRYLAEQPCT
ncbi:MAG: NTP transferase domain-containing protein [Candidatus Methylomirabilis oxygeniifera]|nr:MAG: NTP transferase domain-containing protein [Candidatus Methylomirabilis oxyfera]